MTFDKCLLSRWRTQCFFGCLSKTEIFRPLKMLFLLLVKPILSETGIFLNDVSSSLTVSTAMPYCDDLPTFSGSTSTTCTTLVQAGEGKV